MQLVYGTGNSAKTGWMKKALEGLDFDIIGMKELGKDVPPIAEEGNTSLENAREKAFCYYKAFRRPVFSCQ